jgi:hypothetical protein
MAGLQPPWPAMGELAREGRNVEGEGEGRGAGGTAARRRKGGRDAMRGSARGAQSQHGCS